MTRTRKRPYTGSKRFDKSCRNHGACNWCMDNRLVSYNRDLSGVLVDKFDGYRVPIKYWRKRKWKSR